MRLSFLSLLPAVAARITGLAAPSTIAPGAAFPATLLTQNYIQSVADLSVAFGLSSVPTTNWLGTTYLGSFYLGPDKSNVLQNLTFVLQAPAALQVGQQTYLSAVLTSLYGVSHGASSVMFHLPVLVGTNASAEVKSTESWDNVCSSGTPSSNDTAPIDPADATCFTDDVSRGNLTTLLPISQAWLTALLGDLAREDNATALLDFPSAKSSCSDVMRTVIAPDEGCVSLPTQPWPPHLTPDDSRVRARQILEGAQDGFKALADAAQKCDRPTAASITCRVIYLVNEVGKYWGL